MPVLSKRRCKKAEFAGARDGLGAPVHAKLCVEVAHVRFHGMDGQVELVRDF